MNQDGSVTINSQIPAAQLSTPANLNPIDRFLIHPPPVQIEGLQRFVLEFFWFGIKEARACLFAGLFFLAIFTVPRTGVFGIARYDILLIIAVVIQSLMVMLKLENWAEVKAITLFHILGFILEVFKTSPAIGSWQYPEAGWSKIFGVPLFSGFMYAAVGSYLIQCWRLQNIRIYYHPPHYFDIDFISGLVCQFFYSSFYW